MRQQFWTALVAAAFALTFMAVPAVAQESSDVDPVANLPWQVGPTKGAIAGKATMEIPDGYAFLDAEGTRKLNELLENPPSDADEYTLAPKDLHWFAFFHFSDVGYVKDNESLDIDAILKSVREGTEASNADRSDRVLPSLTCQAHRTRVAPTVNPAPTATNTTKSPRMSRPARTTSSSASGRVAAVVLP